MLLRVIFKNFLSFDDEVQFDMFPNPKRKHLPNHVYFVQNKVNVLKMTAFYGANGAGKSNFVHGLHFIKEFVTNKEYLNADNIDRFFFTLKENAFNSPIEFDIEFSTERKSYIYSAEIERSGVKSETLYISGLGDTSNVIVFQRNYNSIKFSQNPSKDILRLTEHYIDSKPFASVMSLNSNDLTLLNDKNIVDAQRWINDGLEVVGTHSIIPGLIELYDKDKELTEFAAKLFNNIGLGIGDVSVKTDNFDEWAVNNPKDAMQLEHLKGIKTGAFSKIVDNKITHLCVVDKGIRKICQLMFKQFGKDGYHKDMNIEAQSDGTVRILTIIPALFLAIHKNKTVVVDEIDNSIHPYLIREIVRYFSKQKTTGQLLFTTHQTCLLNKDFISDDEVWFVDKKDGDSRMYSLNDFKEHRTLKIENGYLEGRYGAIPFIGDFDL